MYPISISPLYLPNSTDRLKSLFAPCYHLKPKLGPVAFVGIVYCSGGQCAQLPLEFRSGTDIWFYTKAHENTGTRDEMVVETEIGVDIRFPPTVEQQYAKKNSPQKMKIVQRL